MAPAHLRLLVIALYTWGAVAGHVCLISGFGPLDPTGARLSTPALQAGLDACADGGTLVFDLPGAFLTGGLVAHGTIHIHLQESVRLLASDRVRGGAETSRRAPLARTIWDGVGTRNRACPGIPAPSVMHAPASTSAN